MSGLGPSLGCETWGSIRPPGEYVSLVLPLPSLGLEQFRECLDSYAAVRDSGRVTAEVAVPKHIESTWPTEAPSDGGPDAYRGFVVLGTPPDILAAPKTPRHLLTNHS
jgi:hypothetical protein